MPETPRPTLSSKLFKYWIVDRIKGEIRLIFQDGRELTAPLDSADLPSSSQIAQFIFDWDKWWVENITTRGHFVAAEAYSPTAVAPLHGRKTVYLDQNHWSTVGAALTTPSRVRNKVELEAALELAHLANDGGVVVPISAAHLRETAALYGDRRYEVGIAMASLSAGWQFRHPNHVWRNEIVRTLATELGLEAPVSSSLPVISLEPHALMDDDVRAYEMAPDGTELFLLALGGPSVILELLIDPECAPHNAIPEWVDRQVKLSSELAQGNFTTAQKRSAAYALLWSDNSEPVHLALTELGVDVSALVRLTGGDVPRLFQSEPMLRDFSHLMTQRLINSSARWRENDLTDLMFLSAATGYADYVAAENYTGTQLRQAQESRGEPVTVFTSIRDLVTQIRADGVTTVSEGHEAVDHQEPTDPTET